MTAPTWQLAIKTTEGLRRVIIDHIRSGDYPVGHLGLSRQAWDELVAESADQAFLGSEPGIWMVECSRKDVEELSLRLSTLLRRSVNPLLVEDVARQLHDCGPDDIFLTTPFHYEEVSAMLEAERSLLNVNVVPTTDTLVAFA